MASTLWQTSFIVRAHAPLSLDRAFRHIRLLIHSGDGDDCILHTLCLSLLRAAAATSSTPSPFCIAFPEGNTTISVVFPANREVEIEQTVQHVLTSIPEIKVDPISRDEFGSGLAMENALMSSLAAALVCDGWIVLEDNLAVRGGILEWIDGAPTEAFVFAVHTELNNDIDFLISPDVIRFRCFKIERFLSGPMKRLFDGGAVVILDNYLENMSPDDVQKLKCITIPSMKEGCVSGFCKSLPKDFTLDKHKEIWAAKHGLVLPGEEFYIRVSFPAEENTIGLWFPSCLVLQSCGLIPALPSIRLTKVSSILWKVTSSISRLDFFNSGKLKLKSILQKRTQNVCWTTANTTLQNVQTPLNDSNFDLDLMSKVSNFESGFLENFRRPKLPPSHYAESKSTEPLISDAHGVDDLLVSGHSIYPIKPVVASIPTNLKVPVFSKRKIRSIRDGDKHMQTPCAAKACEIKSQKENLKIYIEQQRSCTKKPQGSVSKVIAGDTIISLPKKKRVFADQENNTSKKLQAANSNSKSNVSEISEGSSLLNKKKAPNCSQTSIQKPGKLPTPSTDTPNAIIEPNTCVKQPLQGKSLLANHSNEQQGQQATSKTKDLNALKVATGEKKPARGEKKNIDSETNQKKVLSKHAVGRLSDLTLPELKLFLSENKAKVSGKKEELVHRVILLLSSLNLPQVASSQK